MQFPVERFPANWGFLAVLGSTASIYVHSKLHFWCFLFTFLMIMFEDLVQRHFFLCIDVSIIVYSSETISFFFSKEIKFIWGKSKNWSCGHWVLSERWFFLTISGSFIYRFHVNVLFICDNQCRILRCMHCIGFSEENNILWKTVHSW